MKHFWGLYAQISGLALLVSGSVFAAETSGTIELSVTNGTKHLVLPKVSGVDEFKVLRSTSVTDGFLQAGSGTISGYNWLQPGQQGMEFFRVEMRPKDPRAVLNATLLNRIAYGPTPDELERLTQIGPDAYIREQLAPEAIQESLAVDRVVNPADWQYVTMTAPATSGNRIYIYTQAAGDCYVDDIKLVRGSVPEAGPNLIVNGDFEAGLTGWTVSDILTNSTVATDVKHSGASSLYLVATDNGTGQTTSISRGDFALTAGETVTLSYWVRTGKRRFPAPLLIRLSGATESNGIYSPLGLSAATKLEYAGATLSDLAAWHAIHAVESKKQLLEVLLQFLENHFVTQETKSRDYFDGIYDGEEDLYAANLEYREIQRWRQALLNPQVTFHDLLKISAESPAMIIYLDTVNSRGDGTRIANENYARELLELFTFGVDNGYDQNDITVMSRAWTGWSVEIVDYTNEFNPFAPLAPERLGNTNDPVTRADREGIWAFNYKANRHSAGPKVIFPGKTVPTRFGAPYVGRNYELKLAAGGGTNWQYITMSGTNRTLNAALYIYNTGTGDCYVDDMKIVAGSVPEAGANLLQNGNFENGLNGWTVSANLTGSSATGGLVHSGGGALHLVSTAPGTGRTTAIWRQDHPLATNQIYTLSYWYLPGTNMNGNLVLRLSGDGINSSPGTSTNSIQEGYQVIAHLADQPFTQEFISVKLCRLLVHDDFATGYDFTDPNLSAEGQLVQACMQAWENGTPKGQIRKVLEVILNSELFRSQGASMQKVKTPFEFTVSAVRALRSLASDGTYTASADGNGIRTAINRMGRMRLFDRAEPDGWPEAGAPWISAGTLTERLRFTQALLSPTGSGRPTDAGNNVADPVKLLKEKLPQTAWNDANAVAEYFTNILYPGEGRANLDDYRQAAVGYLNTGDDGVAASAFSGLINTSTAYSTRVRGMVAMLMTFPRFQEQ
jgi:uncharacterized protein (DUF1800 family)